MLCFTRPENKFNRLFFYQKRAIYFSFNSCIVPLLESRFSSNECFTKQWRLRQPYLSPLSLTSRKFKISLILVSTFYQGKNCACLNRGNVAVTTFWHRLISDSSISLYFGPPLFLGACFKVSTISTSTSDVCLGMILQASV